MFLATIGIQTASVRWMGARSLSRLCGQLEKVSEADFLEHRFVYLQKMEQQAATAVDALNSDAYLTLNGITAQAG